MTRMASLLPIVILTLFGYSQTEYDLGGAANRTAEFADFNGDGSTDVLAMDNIGDIRYYQSVPGSGFNEGELIFNSSNWESGEGGIDVADFNEDGHMDFVVIEKDTGVRTFLNDGAGNFTENTAAFISFNDAFFVDLGVGAFDGLCLTYDIAASDRDDDGHIDLTFFLQKCLFEDPFTTEGLSFVFRGIGDGTFNQSFPEFSFYLPPVPQDSPGWVNVVADIDFNGNGYKEVLTLICTGGGFGGTCLLVTHGEGWDYSQQGFFLDSQVGQQQLRGVDYNQDALKDVFILSANQLTGYKNNDGSSPLAEDSILFTRNGLTNAVDFDFADFNGDGALDYALLQNNGDVAEVQINDGMGGFNPLAGPWNETEDGQICQFFERDGIDQLFISSSIGNRVYSLQYVGLASGLVYLDMDDDQSYGAEDVILSNVPVQISDNLSVFSGGDGFTVLYGEPGDYSISLADYNEQLFTPIPPESYDFTLDLDEDSILDLNLGLAPNGIQENLITTINSNQAVCNLVRNHTLSIFSESNTYIDGQVAYTVDSLCLIISAPTADSIVGNTAYFSFEDALMYQSFNHLIEVQMPNEDFSGETLVHGWLATFGTGGTDEGTFEQVLFCAYDPNDKQEFIGTTSFGFIDPDQEYLDYLIRFQNTGNFPATDVVLEDSLHAALDPYRILVTGHSHEYVLEVDTNDVAYFIFEDIMLPDSTSNEPESHGFVRFRIAFDEELIPGDSISNTAGIYFDLNAPIITNTAYNTVFSCGLFGMVPSILDTGMNVLNADGNYLFYQWSLSGVDIDGAVGSTLNLSDIDVAGDIVLTTADSLGCVYSSDPYPYVPSSIQNFGQNGWGPKPNPSQGVFILSSVPIDSDLIYQLFDQTGRLIQQGRLAAGTNQMDISDHADGIYLLSLTDASGRRFLSRLVKQ